MREMMELVAKAIDDEIFRWREATGFWNQDALPGPIARAAIEAMREPTKKMALAGAEEINAGCAFTTEDATRVWLAMIDAALAPAEKVTE